MVQRYLFAIAEGDHVGRPRTVRPHRIDVEGQRGPGADVRVRIGGDPAPGIGPQEDLVIGALAATVRILDRIRDRVQTRIVRMRSAPTLRWRERCASISPIDREGACAGGNALIAEIEGPVGSGITNAEGREPIETRGHRRRIGGQHCQRCRLKSDRDLIGRNTTVRIRYGEFKYDRLGIRYRRRKIETGLC